MSKRFGNFDGRKPKWKGKVGSVVTIYKDPRTQTKVEGPAKLVGRRGSPLDIEGLELWSVSAVASLKYPGVAIAGMRYIRGRG